MSNLNQVLEFIKNSDREDLNSIIDQINIRKSELRYAQKLEFKVGDIVGINHRKMDPSKTFRIIKINNKNIKVASSSNPIDQYTVSPSLLVKK